MIAWLAPPVHHHLHWVVGASHDRADPPDQFVEFRGSRETAAPKDHSIKKWLMAHQSKKVFTSAPYTPMDFIGQYL